MNMKDSLGTKPMVSTEKNLDALIREYAEREAVESDYAVEEVDLQDETDGAGQPEAERPRYIKGKRAPC